MNNPQNLPFELKEYFKENWEAFVQSSKAADIEISIDPDIYSALQKVWAFSPFVAKNCVQYPALLQDLIHSHDLTRCYEKDEYHRKLQKALNSVTNEAELKSALRRLRRREMVRIAFRDLAAWADYHTTVLELSLFAEACIQSTLSLLHTWQCHKMGTPTSEKGTEQRMVVVAMGKLGARELNFSSDIDLIFAYPEAGKTRGTPSSVSNDEFFMRLARQLINVLGAPTEEGIVFRVDMRLRPYGESGPLVMDFDAMEEYYQSQGREWERYAWIKARIVAGEQKAGEQLLEILKPFIYRRYLDYSVFDSLREMKQMISYEVQRKGLWDDIKLGPGGIREIEFIGQTFQLIRGGRILELQERNILKVLDLLSKNNFLSADVSKALGDAYIFLRNTEHRLQECWDQQTHNLPQDAIGKERLACSMGYPHWESFLEALNRHRINVQNTFNHLLTPHETDTQAEAFKDDIAAIWHGTMDQEQALNILASLGIDDPNTALNLLNHLKNAYNTRALGPLGSYRLSCLIPLVLMEVATTQYPTQTLKRLIDLIESIVRRTSYITLLVENRTVLSHLIKLCSASPWIAKLLAKHPILLDELIDPRTLYAPPDRSTLENDLNHCIRRFSENDLEQQMEELRIFKQTNVLRVAAADVSNALPLMKVSDHLTDIAEVILIQVINLAWRHLEEKHGRPACSIGGKVLDKGFAVVAYGKLGGIELGYSSDLDLVFLHAGTKGETQGGPKPIDNALFFSRLGQRVIHILTTHTPSGVLYEIDMRLRPSGSSGMLVSHVEAFSEYQLHQAWTWEHQALVRARIIAGDIDVSKYFTEVRNQVLSRPRDPVTLRQEIFNMRQRMRKELGHHKPGQFDIKQDPGGIVDIEFLVQYAILLKAHEQPRLLKWTDNVRQLEDIAHVGIMTQKEAMFLKEAYLAYRSKVHRLSLQEKSAQVPDYEFQDMRAQVIDIWERIMNPPAS